MLHKKIVLLVVFDILLVSVKVLGHLLGVSVAPRVVLAHNCVGVGQVVNDMTPERLTL